MRTKFANGAHYGAYAPISYQKHPEIKGKLVIDTEYKWIVEKIFDLAAHGKGGAAICRILTEEKVPTPAWINYQRHGTFAHIFEGKPDSKRYQLTTAQADEGMLLERLMKSDDRQHAMEMSRMKKELAQTEKRLAEIDNLFSKLYEDRAKGKVTERNFLMLTNKYPDEQKSMEEKIADYTERIKQTALDKQEPLDF